MLLGWSSDTGSDAARVLLPETGQGSVALARDDLAQRFPGVVLFVRPHFRFDKRTEAMAATTMPESPHWF